MDIIKQTAPPQRSWSKRITKQLEELPVNPEQAVILDLKTSACLKDYARNHGWKLVQKQINDKQKANWRVA